MLVPVLGATALLCVVATAVAPPVVSWLFDFDQELSRPTCLLLTLAVGLFLVAVVLAQALLALGHHLWVTTGWLLGLVGLAAGTALDDDVVARANPGLLCGAVVATASLALLLQREWSRWPSDCSPRGDMEGRPVGDTDLLMSATPADRVRRRPPGDSTCSACAGTWPSTVGLASVLGLAGMLDATAPARSSTPTTSSTSSWPRDGRADPRWLAIDNYGHFAPLTRLAYFAVQRTVGLDYTSAALLPAALIATHRSDPRLAVPELLGRRWPPLVWPCSAPPRCRWSAPCSGGAPPCTCWALRR